MAGTGVSLDELVSLLATAEPAGLGPGPRAGVQTEPALRKAVTEMLSRSKIPERNQELLLALVLLWHDHLDAAHSIAQSIDNPDGAFVHGIMHRREPDYGNAKYWFRRVGEHAAFSEIARRVAALTSAPAEVRNRLVKGNRWDAFAMVDLCEEAGRGSGPAGLEESLREVQRLETEVLMERFAGLS